MALGTVTKPSGKSDYDEGNKRVRTRDVQLTAGANYTAGGETILANQVGLNEITEAQPLGLALPTGGATSRSVGFIYQSNGSVKMVVHTTASAEAAGNSDQSTFTQRVRFVGR
jgi:hypothetical protein